MPCYGSFLPFRKRFLALSANPKQAEASGLNVLWWDFVFYMPFGLVETSLVHSCSMACQRSMPLRRGLEGILRVLVTRALEKGGPKRMGGSAGRVKNRLKP